ncbi:hypothetical protein BDV3_005831 [Batrachochytrium dendrobatidis]|uniref:WW domain-containing protein n=1 Tax=Batrachochytrium dendrobatidis (strain JEL423) TaxID=403673 RepID=A0A177WNH2_BATDL|nr:hypothetical protein BDEG_24582 [Batrachochytrium dendrobatidis JEL423]
MDPLLNYDHAVGHGLASSDQEQKRQQQNDKKTKRKEQRAVKQQQPQQSMQPPAMQQPMFVPQFPYYPMHQQIPSPMNVHMAWSSHVAPNGTTYYYNSVTRESTWKAPPIMPVEPNQSGNDQQQDEPLNYTDTKSDVIPDSFNNNTDSNNLEKSNITLSPKLPKQDLEISSDNSLDSDDKSEDQDSNDDSNSDSSEENDQTMSERAIAMKVIPDTSWAIVLTNMNHEFYFEQESNAVSWDMPEKVVNIIGELLADAMNVNLDEYAESEAKDDDDQDGLQYAQDDVQLDQSELLDAKNQINSLKRTADTASFDPTDFEPAQQMPRTTQDFLETENLQSTSNEPISPELTHADRLQSFNEMLKEINPSPFATWESEETKMCNDLRFKLISNPKERRKLFDKYCEIHATAATKEAVAATKDARQIYMGLLETETTIRSKFSDLSRKFKRDPRFTKLTSTYERESLFNAHMDKLKERQAKRRQEESNNIKSHYIDMLKETKWINSRTSWSDVCQSLGSDKRFCAVSSPIHRETWFRTFISSLSTSLQSKCDDQTASIREREEQVRIERSTQQRKARAQLDQLQHDEAVVRFQSLLIDSVKKHSIKFEDIEKSLEKDSRYPHRLDLTDRKSVFEKHTDMLFEKRLAAFHSLLDTVTKLTSTYADLASFLNTDARTIQLEVESDLALEQIFNSYMAKKRKDANTALEVSFSKNAFIDFHVRAAIQSAIVEAVEKGLKEPAEGDEWRWISLHEIKQVMQSERTWLVFDAFPLERDRMLMKYVKQVAKRVRDEKGGTKDRVVASFGKA